MNHQRTTIKLSALAFAIAAGAAAAQSNPAVDEANREAQRQQQLERQRQEEQFQKDRSSAAPPARLPVPALPTPSQAKGPCRNVREIRVQGAGSMDPTRLEALVAPYRARCLGVSDIEGLLTDLTRAYVDRGRIMMRAYLPQQDLTTGNLLVTVVEGQVSAIEIDDEGTGSISLGNVAPFTIGQPLNIRDFEQALDQINRLASNSATVDMKPGATPGDTIVVLRNRPTRPLHASLSVDNQGSRSTGRHQAGFTLSADNPLHFDDFISVTHRQSVHTEEGQASNSDSLSYVLPIGYTTLSVNISRSKYESTVTTGAGTLLHNSGDSATDALRAERVLYRDATTRVNASANLTRKATRAFLEGTLLDTSSRVLTVLDAGISVSTVVAGGALSVDFGESQGLPQMGALHDADGLPDSAPRAQFRKWTLGGSYQRPFKLFERDLQWSAQWSMQHAEHVLYGSEQMLVGGIYTVRGFTDSTISGDHGGYLRNELGTRVPLNFGSVSGSLRPWIGVDVGAARSRTPGLPQGTLVGAAVGLQMNLQNGLSVDLFTAAPLNKPDFLQREAPSTWLRISLGL